MGARAELIEHFKRFQYRKKAFSGFEVSLKLSPGRRVEDLLEGKGRVSAKVHFGFYNMLFTSLSHSMDSLPLYHMDILIAA